MKNSSISVLIPNFNHGKYLNQSVAGVLEQNYENFEIVIYDDGSSDGSQDIILSLAKQDNRIRYIFSGSNEGTFSGIRNLLDSSNGEFVLPLAADDFHCNQSMLGDYIEQFDKFSSAGFIFGKSIEINGEANDEDLWPYGYSHREGLISGVEFVEAYLKGALLPNTFTAMYRRDALDYIGRFDSTFGPIGDTHAMVKLGIIFGAVFIDKYYSRTRIMKKRYGDSLTTDLYIKNFARLENEIRLLSPVKDIPKDWLNIFRSRVIEYKLRATNQINILDKISALNNDLGYWSLFYLPIAYEEMKNKLVEFEETTRKELVENIGKLQCIFNDICGPI
jgi:glycosyltransferase involved in cell wall biosynthesis